MNVKTLYMEPENVVRTYVYVSADACINFVNTRINFC